MKWIFIFFMFLFSSIITQAQNSRWKQFPLSDTSSKLFIDTTRTQKIIGFDGRVIVVVLWAKLFTKAQKKGDPTESLEKFAVDVETSQIELKLLSAKVNPHSFKS